MSTAADNLLHRLALISGLCLALCGCHHLAARRHETPVEQDHSRFHPVPTQPVFTPRDDACGEMPAGVVPGGPGSGSPQGEVVPAPAAPVPTGKDFSSRGGIKAEAAGEVPQRLPDTNAKIADRRSWIFTPTKQEKPRERPDKIFQNMLPNEAESVAQRDRTTVR